MSILESVLYGVFPYVCLTFFVVGHAFRYVTDRYGWNARSSEFLEKKDLRYGSVIFHWGVVLTFVGHAGGLLIPQKWFDAAGFTAAAHMSMAYWSGLAVGLAAFAGVVLLLRRRLTIARVRAAGTINDLFTLFILALVIGAGLFNVLFGHYNVLYTLAPWIRGIVTLTPQPELMRTVPLSYKLHVLGALALLGFSPFSRLVHIWSLPLVYFFRGQILLRRKPAGFGHSGAGAGPGAGN